METRVTGYKKVVCNDAHPYLVAMLKDAQAGRRFPEEVSPDEYKRVKNSLDTDPGLSGFVGFGCSYAGKWFGGYAKNDQRNNYAAQSSNSLSKAARRFGPFEFRCGDYASCPVFSGSVVYADPPYQGTTGYSTGAFDSDVFWKFAKELSQKGSSVFISEESGPEWATVIWEKPLRRWADNANGKTFTATEKLYYLPPGG